MLKLIHSSIRHLRVTDKRQRTRFSISGTIERKFSLLMPSTQTPLCPKPQTRETKF